MGGAVAEWSKAQLVRENKRKSKRSQVRPQTWAPFIKKTLLAESRSKLKHIFINLIILCD